MVDWFGAVLLLAASRFTAVLVVAVAAFAFRIFVVFVVLSFLFVLTGQSRRRGGRNVLGVGEFFDVDIFLDIDVRLGFRFARRSLLFGQDDFGQDGIYSMRIRMTLDRLPVIY